ncbi:hypothetical protein N9045_00960 [bacterium]|nr:hypothetical protein [bacterium]
MSKFSPTEKVVTPLDNLNESLMRADKESKRQLTSWMQMLDVFWCAPVTHGENARSKEDMQAIIDADPVKAQVLLSASASFIAYRISEDPDLATEMVPARYLLEGAYTWVEGTLTLDQLRPEWDVQPEE